MQSHSVPQGHRSVRVVGRDELNLIDFPISQLRYQQPLTADKKLPDEVVCIVESYDRDLDEVVPRKLTKRTASKHGFPTPVEDEVLVGLLTLTRIKNNFKEPRIRFRNGELYELMGWPHNGNSNKRFAMALDRLTGLTLKYENSWTIEDGTFQKEFTTGLLDSYNFVKQTAGTRMCDRERTWIQWASEVFADIQNGNVKELNTDEFFSLQRPIAQRLYRFLDKQFSQSPHFEIDVVTLAEHLGISERRHLGKIKERLSQGLKELEALETFVVPATREQRFHRRGPGQWTVKFDRRTNPVAIDSAPAIAPTPKHDADEPARLVREFYSAWRGREPSVLSKKELQHATTLMHRYGEQKLFEALPKVIKVMKREFPAARVFGACVGYFDDVLARAAKAKRPLLQSDPIEDTRPQDVINRKRRQDFRKQWRSLSSNAQGPIIEKVASAGCDSLRKLIARGRIQDPLVEIACMEEFERQLSGT